MTRPLMAYKMPVILFLFQLGLNFYCSPECNYILPLIHLLFVFALSLRLKTKVNCVQKSADKCPEHTKSNWQLGTHFQKKKFRILFRKFKKKMKRFSKNSLEFHQIKYLANSNSQPASFHGIHQQWMSLIK